MLGVVLWSDTEDQKAVFWCEDQGDLAFYDAATENPDTVCVLNAGDMVQFDLITKSKIRRARNARVVEQKVCNGIQDELRKNAVVPKNTDRRFVTGDVVHLHGPATNTPKTKRMINS